MAESFDRIDTDDSGVITVANLQDFLGDELSDSYLESVLTEAHQNDSTVPAITYEEFLALWDFHPDRDIQSAKQSVVHEHRRHGIQHTLSSTLSTVSSTISDENNGDDDDDDDHNHASRTGCGVFDNERRKSVAQLYGDV